MIPIVDDKKLRLSGRKFLSANGSRMKVHHLFFIASCPFLDALSIDRKPAFPAITVSIPKSGISVTSRELQKENKGKTSYSDVPNSSDNRGD